MFRSIDKIKCINPTFFKMPRRCISCHKLAGNIDMQRFIFHTFPWHSFYRKPNEKPAAKCEIDLRFVSNMVQTIKNGEINTRKRANILKKPG